MNLGVRLLVVSVALGVVFACSGSTTPDVPTAPAGDAGTSESSASNDGASGGDSTNATETGSADVVSPPQDANPSDLAACKAKAANNPKPACANCACDHCLSALIACDANPKCVALRECAQQQGCCDEVCVLLKCGDALNAAGGIGGTG